MDDNLQGNLSTIITFLFVFISPFIAPYLEPYGISSGMLTEFALAILGVVIVMWSAYNPNSFKIFNNHIKNTCTCKSETEETVLNDEYEDGC